MASKKKIQLIDNWRVRFFKFWSVRIDLIAAAFAGYALAFPDAAIMAWNQFPAELKAYVPVQWTPYISMFLLIASMVARSIKQPKLKDKDDTTSS